MGLRDNRVFKGISGGLSLARGHLVVTSFLLIIFLIVGSFVGYQTTRWLETPEFCSISVCHSSMGAYSEYFKLSAHGQRNLEYKCMECHGETRLGPIENKYVGTLLSHASDSPPAFIGLFQGKKPEPEFDPYYPVLPSERCLRCHAPDSTGDNTFPVTVEDHSKPIDVSEKFKWVLENPRGSEHQCKNCHSFITHPSDTKLLPTERGERFEFTHPAFPKIDLGYWQQSHWHLLRDGGKGGLEYQYGGNSGEYNYEITASELVIDGVPRTLDASMCLVCHKIKDPATLDGKCQGCHNNGDITLFEHGPFLHLPNLNDYVGAKGIVGNGASGGGH